MPGLMRVLSSRALVLALFIAVIAVAMYWYSHLSQHARQQRLVGTWQYQLHFVGENFGLLEQPQQLQQLRLSAELSFLENGEFRRFVALQSDAGTSETMQASIKGNWHLSGQYLALEFVDKQLLMEQWPESASQQQITAFLRFFNSLSFNLVKVTGQHLVMRAESGWVITMRRL